MMKKQFPALSGALIVCLATALPATTMAAGFQLSEQSVRGLGRAFAGGGALAEDSSTVFYNPAGLTALDGSEVHLGASVIALTADFDREVAVDAIGQPLTGGEGGDVGKLGGVPYLYYSHRINPDWVFGFGVNAPFGLATDYDPDWVGRYQGIYSHVSTLNLNPSLGWKINDNFSLGFGLNFMHMRVKLTNMVDYGAVCFGAVNPVTCNAIGLTPQSRDGFAQIEGEGWGYGFNIGALLTFDNTRIGMHYRSRVDQDLSGDAIFYGAPEIFTATNRFVNTGINADFTTPETFSISLVQNLSETFTLTADITRTGWRRYDELRVRYDSAQEDTAEAANWESVFRYSIGLDWEYSDAWTFRTGLALDKSPVPDEYRTVRLPDDDRTWLSFGATWRMSKAMEIDFGYAHLFIDDNISFNENGESGAQGDTLIGTYEASADIIGAAFRYRF